MSQALHPHPLTAAALAALLALIGPSASHAQSTATSGATPTAAEANAAQVGAPTAEAPGGQSRQWLRSQSQREQASPQRQTLTGPAMKAVHDRYVRSFTTPIEATSFHARDQIR